MEQEKFPHKLFKWISLEKRKRERLRKSWNEGMWQVLENYGLMAEDAIDRHQ